MFGGGQVVAVQLFPALATEGMHEPTKTFGLLFVVQVVVTLKNLWSAGAPTLIDLGIR